MKLGILVFALSLVTLNAHADLRGDGFIHQGMGTYGATNEEAVTNVVKDCLVNPLFQKGLVGFTGIDDVTYTRMDDGRVFAYATCVFKPLGR